MKYSDIISINENFQYSINLQFDLNNINKIKEYIPTKDSCQVLNKYYDSILGSYSKATTLVGPYGKGKSHLLLVLLMLLNDYEKSYEDLINNLIEKIKKIDTELATKIDYVRNKKMKYMPVIINSNYNDMNQAFLLAITEALERENLSDLVIDTYFSVALKIIEKWEKENYKEVIIKFEKCLKEQNITLEVLKRKLSTFEEEGYKIFKNVYSCIMHGMEFNPLINSDIIKYYKDINYKICEKGYNGIVIVFDEFSKFLESINNGNMMKDLKLLQDFAELASRTGKSEQIILSCITHKTINEYTKNIKDNKVNAFKTVEGRFKEIFFNKNIEQNYDIISQTIKKKKNFLEKYEKTYQENKLFYKELSEISFIQIDKYEETLFKGCFPLNPITVFALIEISEKIAQNERTLFTFLTDDDSNSFKHFIRNNSEGLFNIDKIYDYFVNSFRKDEEDLIKNIWIKSQNALNRTSIDLEEKIIKAIAIIEMINDFETIVPNLKYISLSLNESEKSIKKCLDNLKNNGIIKFKKITQSYDFSSVYNSEAIKEINRLVNSKFVNINERKTLEKIINLGYVIPRRYNQDYKMTRFFKNIFLIDEEVNNLSSFNTILDESGADGVVITLLRKDTQIDIFNKIATINNELVLIKDSDKELSTEIRQSLREYEAIEYMKKINDYEEEIKKELEFIEQDTIEIIEREIEEITGLENCKIYYRNKTYSNIKNISGLISDICEKVYSETPIINNEMINKNTISAPIVKARNIVIETVLNKNEGLIKSTTSAEATIFKAIVEKKDKKDVDKVLKILKDFIKNSNNKNNFEIILSKLYAKPFGIRKGIMPILISLALEEYIDNVILYYETKEIEIDAINITKIVDAPEKYYISIEEGTNEKIEYVKDLLNIFSIEKSSNQRNDIKNIISEMKKWVLALPRVIREMVETNEIINDKSYIDFKNYILKSDINNNEFLFKKLKEIFRTEDYKIIIKKITEMKQEFDNYLDKYSIILISKTKEIFEHKSKKSLFNILRDWYKNLDKNAKNSVVSLQTKQLFEYARDLNNYNEAEIVQNISLILFGFYINDWQDDTEDNYLEALRKILIEVENLKNIDKEEQEVVEISNGKEKIKKYINCSEISQIGRTLKNNIEDSLDEYGSSVSESEKIKILMELIKKYM